MAPSIKPSDLHTSWEDRSPAPCATDSPLPPPAASRRNPPGRSMMRPRALGRARASEAREDFSFSPPICRGLAVTIGTVAATAATAAATVALLLSNSGAGGLVDEAVGDPRVPSLAVKRALTDEVFVERSESPQAAAAAAAADTRTVHTGTWDEGPLSEQLSRVLRIIGPSKDERDSSNEDVNSSESDSPGDDRGGGGYETLGQGAEVESAAGPRRILGKQGGKGGANASSLRSLQAMGERGRCFYRKGEQRCHANVFFFGVSKCGTTSFAKWMSYHPVIRWILNSHKMDQEGAEAHVFDNSVDNWHKMLNKGSHGEYAASSPVVNETEVVIDYTPHYSIVAEVPYRIGDRYGSVASDGSVKYLALLREPVARTISSWQFKFDMRSMNMDFKEKVAESRSFVEAVKDGRNAVERLLKCRERHETGHGDDLSEALILDLAKCNPRRYLEGNLFVSHVGKSMYVLQLERWFRLFGRDNIKIVFLEEMAEDPVGTLEDVFDFIGLDFAEEEAEASKHHTTKIKLDVRSSREASGQPLSGSHDHDREMRLPTRKEWTSIVKVTHNTTGEKKKRILDKQITDETIQSLRDYFAPHNSALEDLLGRPLPASWSKSG